MPDDPHRVVFATHDFTQAHDLLRRVYGGHEMRLRRLEQRFTYRQEVVRAGPVTVGRVRYGAAIEMFPEPFEHWLFCGLSGGRLEPRDGRDAVSAVAGDTFVSPIARPIVSTCDHATLYTVGIDPGFAAEIAATGTGLTPGEFTFTGMRPVSPTMNRYWWETMRYLYDVLAGPGRGPLVIQAVAGLAARAAIATFPNTAMSAPHPPGPGTSAPTSTRRAIDFIEAHADEPITLAQVAEAARVGPRALQEGFRRHLGTTPAAYLRRVRLDRARRDLRLADPARGDTVAEIAERWGYPHEARFAADYHATYGVPPWHTLHA